MSYYEITLCDEKLMLILSVPRLTIVRLEKWSSNMILIYNFEEKSYNLRISRWKSYTAWRHALSCNWVIPVVVVIYTKSVGSLHNTLKEFLSFFIIISKKKDALYCKEIWLLPKWLLPIIMLPVTDVALNILWSSLTKCSISNLYTSHVFIDE